MPAFIFLNQLIITFSYFLIYPLHEETLIFLIFKMPCWQQGLFLLFLLTIDCHENFARLGNNLIKKS